MKECPVDKPWDDTARDCVAPPEPQNCENKAGNPINFFSGHKLQREPVFEASGDFPLTFSWLYNSFGNHIKTGAGYSTGTRYVEGVGSVVLGETMLHTEPPLPAGARRISLPLDSDSSATYIGGSIDQWRHNHSYFLAHYTLADGVTERLIAYRPDGGDLHFVAESGIFVALANREWRVTKDLDAGQEHIGWTLQVEDHIEKYDTAGRILRVENEQGWGISYSYDGAGIKQQKIADDHGNSIDLVYSGGKLTQITRNEGSVYQFAYNSNGLLESITFPGSGNPQRIFRYEDIRFPNALTGVTDEAGKVYSSFTYDDNGRAIRTEHSDGAEALDVAYVDSDTRTLTNALGKQTTYHYTDVYGVQRITTVEGVATANCAAANKDYTYNTNGWVETKTDWKGVVTRYAYNGAGQVTSITEAEGTAEARITTYEWHPDFNLRTKVTEPGRETRYSYDNRGRLLTRTVEDLVSSATRIWTYTYHPDTQGPNGTNPGKLATVDGPRTDIADVTSYGYDPEGRLVQVTNALGHETQITAHDAANRPLTLVDANGVTTTLTYTVRGWLATSTIGGKTTSFTYDQVGQLTDIQVPNGTSLHYDYDDARRLTGIEDALGNRIDYTLDAAGNRTEERISDAQGNLHYVQQQLFDELSRLIQTIGANYQTNDFEYDVNGNRTGSVDPNTNPTSMGFDALNHLSSITNALAGQTVYRYNALEQLEEVVDPRGNTTRYTRNAFGDVVELNSPDTGITQYQYDAAGNRIQTIDANGIVTAFQYDALNRLTRIDHADNNYDVQFSYDETAVSHGIGRLTGISDASGTTSYSYTDLGLLASVGRTMGSHTFTTGYSYDATGLLTGITLPSGRSVSISRDAAGQTAAIQAQINQVAYPLASNISYQPFGPVNGFDYGNQYRASRTYGLDGKLTRLNMPTGSQLSNAAPTGNAGPDQQVKEGELVTLDGSGSSDPEAEQLSYLWTQLSGISVSLDQPTSATPTFRAPPVVNTEVLEFELRVTDPAGAFHADSVQISVADDPNYDGDSDGMPDEWEITYGFDPADPNDADLDPDNDGISNLDEYYNGTDPGLVGLFAQPPALLTQLQSANNETANVPAEASQPWLTVAVQNLQENQVDLALERAEAAPGSIVTDEVVGIVAFADLQSGSLLGSDDQPVQYQALVSADNIEGWDNGCYTTSYPSSFSGTPIAVAAPVRRDGADGGWLRRCSASAQSLGLTLDEDTYNDSERGHTTEAAAILAFGRRFDAEVTAPGNRSFRLEADQIILNDTAQTPSFVQVNFRQTYSVPPVVITMATDEGGDPAAVRIRSITTTGFEIAQVEPPNLDGTHVSMTVPYIAIEPGLHNLNGRAIYAGTQNINAVQFGPGVSGTAGWQTISLPTQP